MTQTTQEATLDCFLGGLLDEQQSLSAVDRFAQTYETNGTPAGAKYYRDLIPVSAPEAGQQYAFEVDLDACSGCKACVAACHSLNGLEETELWRNVGQLVGGTNELPVVQHVTTACHHCIEPACLEGCPVEAYEKDPVAGIVRHLDDQCIGCQYCMLKCPYDVPVYSKSKGIVRKCDMCHQRLAVGEAPACVQSCPNQAIRIRLVEKEAVLDATEANQFLPAAPEPGYTVPTTIYKSSRPLPHNALPADYFAVQRSHAHLPLVFMLVLTQMSVGAFFVEQMMYSYFSFFREDIAASVRPLHLGAALVLGLLGLAASVFHLGRPLFAFRALLGLRTSWLSREILAFGIFATASTAYVVSEFVDFFGLSISESWQAALGVSASATGVVAVGCSVMIYVDTRRPCWKFPATSAKFLLTALILGIPTALLILLVGAGATSELTAHSVMAEYGRTLCQTLLIVVVMKLSLEASVLTHLKLRQHTPHKRSAMLMTGELGMTTLRRFFFGVVGGIVLPLVLLAEGAIAADSYHPLFVGGMTLLMLGLLTIGELHERYLFFAASVAPKMPGAPAS
jgi:Fe-S-cluster-containing dehydrogenase component/DMSO reductase anchor subunit